jgi:hypothetical protein
MSTMKATVYTTVTIIALYFTLIFVGNNVLHVGIADSSAIFLSIIPFIVYLILSGKIREFKGGGIEVKFKEAFEKNVNFKPERAHYIDYRIVRKGGRKALSNIVLDITRSPFTALSLTIGQHYDYTLLRDYLKELVKFDFFKYVIFIDSGYKFKGFMAARVMLSHLREDQMGHQVIDLIEGGEIREVEGFRKDFVRNTASSKEVLHRLETEGIADIAVVDENSRFLGFTDRETIVTKVVSVFLASS